MQRSIANKIIDRLDELKKRADQKITTSGTDDQFAFDFSDDVDYGSNDTEEEDARY